MLPAGSLYIGKQTRQAHQVICQWKVSNPPHGGDCPPLLSDRRPFWGTDLGGSAARSESRLCAECECLRPQPPDELAESPFIEAAVPIRILPEDETHLLARVQCDQRDFRPIGVSLTFDRLRTLKAKLKWPRPVAGGGGFRGFPGRSSSGRCSSRASPSDSSFASSHSSAFSPIGTALTTPPLAIHLPAATSSPSNGGSQGRDSSPSSPTTKLPSGPWCWRLG